MSTETINIFLSSRFAQLRDYRNSISQQISERLAEAFPIQLIDMDDGRAREQPPKDTCISAVRSSEFMILMVDDSYGAPAPNSEFSFTHLEYLEAVRKGSQTKVLCYFISDYPIGSPDETRLAPRLQNWRKQLTDKHTPVSFSRNLDISSVCSQIVRDLHAHLVEWLQRKGAAATGQMDVEETLEIDERPIDEDLLDQLEKRRHQDYNSERSSVSIPSLPDGPNVVLAKEQEELSEYAQRVGELEVAIAHLSTCLDLVPLQPRLQYRLALLFLAQPTRPRLQHAAALLEQCSRVFIAIEKPYWAAASLTALARVRITLDPNDAASALSASEKAASIREDFKIARYEHARLLASLDRSDAALEVLDTLGWLSPRYFAIAFQDPAFDTCRDGLRGRLRSLKRKMSEAARKIKELDSHLTDIQAQDASADLVKHCELIPQLPADFADLTTVKMVQALRSYNASFSQWIRHLGGFIAYDLGNTQRQAERSLREMQDKGESALKWAGLLAVGALFGRWFGNVPSLLAGMASLATFVYWYMNRNRISQAIAYRAYEGDAATAPALPDLNAGQLEREKQLKSKQSIWIKVLQEWENAVNKLPMEALPFRGIYSTHKANRGEMVRIRLTGLSKSTNTNILVDEDRFEGDTPDVPRLFVVKSEEGEVVRVSRFALADN